MIIDERDIPSDPIDSADYFIESVIDDHVKAAMIRAAEIPVGVAGTCDLCGNDYVRLVNGACGFCRDRYRLP